MFRVHYTLGGVCWFRLNFEETFKQWSIEVGDRNYDAVRNQTMNPGGNSTKDWEVSHKLQLPGYCNYPQELLNDNLDVLFNFTFYVEAGAHAKNMDAICKGSLIFVRLLSIFLFLHELISGNGVVGILMNLCDHFLALMKVNNANTENLANILGH